MNGSRPKPPPLFKRRIIIVIAALLVSGGCTQSGVEQTGDTAAIADCDRDCLNGVVDQYLEALVARDPSRLPLTETVKYTENGQRLELGDGMWGPANGLGDYRITFADPKTGQVGLFGIVKENDHPQIVAIRLKVESRRISEIETIVARWEPDGWNNPDGAVAHPIFSEAVEPAQRRPREEMIAIANSYFEGLEQNTADLTPFDPDCTRMENGNVTANNPEGNPMQQMTCGEQFATGFSTFITRIRERRFPIVDEERGLVYAIILFGHAGTVRTVKMTDGTTFDVSPPFDTPYTLLIGELFKIIDGKIRRIEAVIQDVPYGMPSGWVGGE